MKVLDFLKRYPVLAYLALTFAISWGGMFLAVRLGGLPASEEQSAMLLVFAYIAMLAGPSVAGILLTGIIDGRAGLREVGSRLLKWRVGVRWYVIALLTAPFLIAVVLLVLSRISPAFVPRLFTEDDKAFHLQFSLVTGLMVGVCEELGWTEFAVRRIRLRHGVLRTGLIVGLLYAVWNFPVVFGVSTATSTAGTLPMAIYMLAVLFTWLPTYRVLMVWVYDRTRSLFIAMLMHASLIACWRTFTPLTITGTALVIFYLLFTAAMWIVIAALMKLPIMSRPVRGVLPVGASNQKGNLP